MVYTFLSQKLSFIPRAKSLGKLSLGMILSLGLIIPNSSFAATALASCDVISQATVKVLEIKTTMTEATIKWKEGHSNDSRYFCFGTTPQTSSCNDKVQNRSSHTTVMSGLTPNTKYYYIFYGVGHGKKTTTTGSITPDGNMCVTSNSNYAEVKGTVTDNSNDSLEGVIVTISKTAGGSAVDTDTTSRSGFYSLTVEANNYFVSFSYPPFTSPTPVSIKVESGKTLNVPVQKLTGGFQVGGTVLGLAKDTLKGATVTVTSTTDPTQTLTRKTDDIGHYNFGLKPGTYTLNAFSGTHKIASPIAIKVEDKAVKIETVSLSTPVSISRRNGKTTLASGAGLTHGVKAYQINGARLEQQTQPKHKAEAVQYTK